MRIIVPDELAADAFRRRRTDAQIERLTGETMGTTWSAAIVSPPPGMRATIEAALLDLNAELSHWDTQSALSRFNRTAIGEWQHLPARLRTVLDAGLALKGRTGGAFDPAIGRSADLWGFGPSGKRTDLPSRAEIENSLSSEAQVIERDGDRARRTADVKLDLSGIAKGFSVDILADRFEASGARDFLIEIGGEFVGRGIKPDGQPWWVDLESPPDISLSPLRVALHQNALATSGDYRRFLTQGDRRFGHTLDPRSGSPVSNGVVSVSVLAETCMMADAWATALTVLGAEQGLEIADEDKLAARIILANGREYLTNRMRDMIG